MAYDAFLVKTSKMPPNVIFPLPSRLWFFLDHFPPFYEVGYSMQLVSQPQIQAHVLGILTHFV